MNLESLQKKLLAAARANPPADRVPLAFEQRVLAHLKSRPAADLSVLWARALWRAVVPCVAVTVVLLTFSFVPTNDTSVAPVAVAESEDLAQVFEQTLLASSASDSSAWEEYW